MQQTKIRFATGKTIALHTHKDASNLTSAPLSDEILMLSHRLQTIIALIITAIPEIGAVILENKYENKAEAPSFENSLLNEVTSETSMPMSSRNSVMLSGTFSLYSAKPEASYTES